MKKPRSPYPVLVVACWLLIVAFAYSQSPTLAPRSIVGAIRWDAWVGDASPVGLAVEKSLSPRNWHYRLPFYGKELSQDKVQIRGNSQSVMDSEIAYAASAGLDYWAFVLYRPDDAMTLGGIDLYQSSSHKKDIHFCMLVEGSHLTASPAAWMADQQVLLHYFADAGYQHVLRNRPLLYLLRAQNTAAARAAIAELRQQSHALGLGDPFIVAMDWSPDALSTTIKGLGLDAASSYCSNGGKIGASYSDLISYTEQSWDAYAADVPQVIPWVTTGWDRRPRIENPVFWEAPYGNGSFYTPLRPAELTQHLQDAVRWNAAHPDKAKASAIIIYAWNEFDEGGWLCPTLSEGDARLQAIGKALGKK